MAVMISLFLSPLEEFWVLSSILGQGGIKGVLGQVFTGQLHPVSTRCILPVCSERAPPCTPEEACPLLQAGNAVAGLQPGGETRAPFVPQA